MPNSRLKMSCWIFCEASSTESRGSKFDGAFCVATTMISGG
jgi:hypothetical protein